MKKLFWVAASTLTIVGMLVSVTYHSNAQGRDTRSRPVDGARDGGGNTHFGGAGSRPLDNQSGNLSGTFWFELYTCNRGSATVTFVGNLIQATGSVGDTSFTQTVTGTYDPVPHEPFCIAHMGFYAHCLRAGTWRVSAISNFTGSVTCEATVTGGRTNYGLNLSVVNGASCQIPGLFSPTSPKVIRGSGPIR